MNPQSESEVVGTVGELLVQLHLQAHRIQAFGPHKDTGNDLIALRGRTVRAFQVKTTRTGEYKRPAPRIDYDVLAVVHLAGDLPEFALAESGIYLLQRAEVANAPRCIASLPDSVRLSAERLDRIFQD